MDDVVHHFYRLHGSFDTDLAGGAEIIDGWLDDVNSVPRTGQSLEHLKIALQCGGSDAFSGVSGNPLAAYVAKEVIRYGGCANLAETDELIGSEAYILQIARDLPTARKFLNTIERFKERAAWHGHSTEANPSGGNNFRGLYNIAIKSIGAAMKRHPDVCLDYVIDYSELMKKSGYYFMDSPGNDLESIAGQVASGSNMIFFVTGNGSITNFPFVPTLKIVTTTGRYDMLEKDMDVNAGAYLDGTPMEELGESMLDLTVDVASGERSVGEKAGHSQVSLWRDWKQTGPVDLAPLLTESDLKSGEPLPIDAVTETQRSVAYASTIPRPSNRSRISHGSSGVDFTDKPLFWTDCTDDRTPLQRTEHWQGTRYIAFCCASAYGRLRCLQRTFRGDLYPHDDRTPHASDSCPRSAPRTRL